MGLEPKIVKTLDFNARPCPKCGRPLPSTAYLKSKALTAENGYSRWCARCTEKLASEADYDWKTLNLLCADLNIPWVPEKFEELRANPNPFTSYATFFQEGEYAHLEWGEYYQAFKKLEGAGLITNELPRLKEERLAKLQRKWGANYSEEQLDYLEQLYEGVLASQNINGKLQDDQAQKLCKTSLEIDERIRGGQDYDKLLSSYEKLVKIADFTPKNAKNAADFDSVGELFRWLEKRGWRNKYYDNVTRDVVDETLKNIENFNQKLYINESGIGDEITRRIEALKQAA